ncbi:hypothetical protein [Luteolibacter sp. Populi]|uniref:hypothetical protein n=1 Tax=Luteolibacter sp. Populi TaxID=3230487 RepID=UPI0034654EF6
MPADPPSNTGSPDRSRPVASDLNKETTEGDLWNLDDEPAEKPARRPSTPRGSPKPAAESNPEEAAKKLVHRMTPPRQDERKVNLGKIEPPEPRDEIGDLEEHQDDNEEEAVLIVLPEDEVEEFAPLAETGVEEEPATKPAEEAGPRQNRPRPEAPAASPAASFRILRPQPRELLGLAAVAFLLLLGVIWVLSRFFAQLSFQSPHTQAPDFPVKGNQAAIVSAETFWRAPVREGANIEKVRRDVAMIPVMDITLDPATSSQGALRLEFRNDRGEKIGDVITRGFQGGRFHASGDPKISIAATDGFSSQGDFNAYLTSDAPPWTVEVREGSSIDGGSASFKPLAIVPVLRSRR